MLTDVQIWSLGKKVSVPVVFCNFKTKLADTKLQYNKTYIINMEDEFDEDGKLNEGSHYTAFQCNHYPNGKVERCYFDSFGQPPPDAVTKFCGGGHIPYSTVDIQSLIIQHADGIVSLGVISSTLTRIGHVTYIPTVNALLAYSMN